MTKNGILISNHRTRLALKTIKPSTDIEFIGVGIIFGVVCFVIRIWIGW